MTQLLWTVESVSAFVTHPDQAVRRWALDRLIQRFSERAAEAVVPLLDDASDFLVLKASEIIAESGDRERYSPVLLSRLPAAKGTRLGRLVLALARLNPEAARSWLLAHLQPDRLKVNSDEFAFIAEALGEVGGDEARQVLWNLLSQLTGDGMGASAVIAALLQAARPEDVRPLVQRLRSWPLPPNAWRTSLGVLAGAVGAGRLAEEIRGVNNDRLKVMLDRAEWWLGHRPALSPELQRALADAFRQKQARLFELLLTETRRLTAVRGDDIAGWRAAWDSGERLAGYRRQAVLTLLILEALAAPLGLWADRLHAEGAMALALVCELGADRDDEGDLARAEDKTAALLVILAANRENVLPDIVERAALGPEIAPKLITLLDPRTSEWGAIRAARALARLARQYPGSCDAAIGPLIALVNDAGGDFLLEAVSEALSAIGPAVVEPIAQALAGSDDDASRQIYLTGVLGEVPTERSAQVLLESTRRDELDDWRELDAFAGKLVDTGSASAIPVLGALWAPDDAHLAEHLLVLHVVNGMDHAQLPEWRRLAQAEDERIAKLTQTMRGALNTDADLVSAVRAAAPPPTVPPAFATPRLPPILAAPREKKPRRGRRSRR